MTPLMKTSMNDSFDSASAVPRARRANGAAEATPPNPEVVAVAKYRRFSGAEKQRILAAADRCIDPGEIGALLRRETIYSSQLAAWSRTRTRRTESLRVLSNDLLSVREVAGLRCAVMRRYSPLQERHPISKRSFPYVLLA